MNRATSLLAGITLIGCVAALAIAEPSLTGPVRVIDGDTIAFDRPYRAARMIETRVRLWGIDAFEINQNCGPLQCGRAAANYLRQLTQGKTVECNERGSPSYGRVVAQCFVLGRDIGSAMVASGWALDWPKYSKGKYKDEQEAAKQEKAGAWATSFIPPWEFRHSK